MQRSVAVGTGAEPSVSVLVEVRGHPGGPLPRTGDELLPALGAGLVLAGVGAVLVRAGRIRGRGVAR